MSRKIKCSVKRCLGIEPVSKDKRKAMKKASTLYVKVNSGCELINEFKYNLL